MLTRITSRVSPPKHKEITGYYRKRQGSLLPPAGGFHILKVYERKPAGISEYDEVSQTLGTAVYQKKKERAVENFLDRLRAKAVILDLPRTA